LTTFSAADWVSYSHLVGSLRDTDVASHALKVGDTAPDFLLPDADGRLHSSEQLRRNGPLVLSFFRGVWCPFCTAELCALQAAKDECESVGETLAVVTPETIDFPRQLKRSLLLSMLTSLALDDVTGHTVIMAHGCHLQTHVGMARSIGLDVRTRFLEPLKAG
jgi:peroxiredoxin